MTGHEHLQVRTAAMPLMPETSVAARRRLHRATVLTTVVAIAPVTLAIVIVTSESWRDGLGFSLGVLSSFLVLLEFEPARHPLSTKLAVVFAFTIWVFCAVLAFNPVAFFGAAILSGVLIPRQERRHLLKITGMGALIATIGCLYFLTEPVTWVNVVRFVLVPGGLSIFVATVILMMQSYWRILDDLEIAQEVEAELGIVRERMRFAGDLHDIQGHTLHVVNLKIALAEELLKRDPEAAAAELREAYLQVEETIRETKNLAYARRTLNLRAELENARNLLDSAGARVRVTRGGEAPDGVSELLAQVLREVTTNILRHAQPTRVSITLSDSGIEILNDGAGEGDLPTLRGLGALRLRVENEGGALTVEQAGGEFRTAVDFPARSTSEPNKPVTK